MRTIKEELYDYSSLGGYPNSSLKHFEKYAGLLKPTVYAISDIVPFFSLIIFLALANLIDRINRLGDFPVKALIFL